MSNTKRKIEDSFGELFDELEKIVQTFEGDTPNIDESLKLFERGLHVAEQLKKKLSKVEMTIEELKKKYQLDDTSTDDELSA